MFGLGMPELVVMFLIGVGVIILIFLPAYIAGKHRGFRKGLDYAKITKQELHREPQGELREQGVNIFCSRCGFSNASDASYCVKCGNKISK